jgi:hypothetical protein
MEIKITEKTDFEGVTYYYLYVDDKFIKLSREKEVIAQAAKIAQDVITSGKHIETVVELIKL